MKALISLCLTASVFVSGAALASAELVAKNKCNTCHSPDKKMIGPTWKDIAAKNKGKKDADKALVASITKGSKDKYGKIPMPAQAAAAADAPALAKWILGQ